MVLFEWEPVVVSLNLMIWKWISDLAKFLIGMTIFLKMKSIIKFYYLGLGSVLKDQPFKRRNFCTLINDRLCRGFPKHLCGERKKWSASSKLNERSLIFIKDTDRGVIINITFAMRLPKVYVSCNREDFRLF